MSKVKVIPAVESTRVVRTEPPMVALELTPTEAYHLYAVLSEGLTYASLDELSLSSLQRQLAVQFFDGSDRARNAPLDLGPWRPSAIGMNAQRPLNFVAERGTKIAERLQQLEKCDA